MMIRDLEEAPPPKPSRGVSPRAILLGLALIPIAGYVQVNLDFNRYSLSTNVAPYYPVVCLLAALSLLNAAVRRRLPARAFTRAELLTLYAMLSIAMALNSTGSMYALVSCMGYGGWFATAENRWADLLLPHLPQWLVVSDRSVLAGYFNGFDTFWKPAVVRAWAGPVLWWCAFAAVWLMTTLCLSILFRRQWTDAERLSYPLVQLPLEITREDGAFWRNRMMWAGFAVAGGLVALNGVNYLFPTVPGVPIKRRLLPPLFDQRPWSGMGRLWLSFYLFAVGLAFLVPLDLSFSCLLFFALAKLQLVLGSATGWLYQSRPGGGFETSFPYPQSQAFGAYTAIAALALWGARGHLARVWRTARGASGGEDDAREPLRYRTALRGAALGCTAMLAFMVAAGLTWWVAVLYLAVYLALAIVVTRIRAESGLPAHDMFRLGGPHNILVAAEGAQALGPRNLALFSLFHWWHRHYGSHPMPHQMESFKLAESAGAHSRGMAVALAATALTAPLCMFVIFLDNAYRMGCATARVETHGLVTGGEAFNQLNAWIASPPPPNTPSLGFAAGGFLFTLLLAGLRLRLPWFPMHPLGYAVASSWGIMMLWMPILIGATAKLALLRFGGLRSYRAAIPFFLGLILGDFAVGYLWALIGILGGFRTFDFWP